MLVVDTSAFVSLAIADCTDQLVAEFDVHTTDRVLDELRATADHDDRHGNAATEMLEVVDAITVPEIGDTVPESSRIDPGEGSCVVCARDIEATFLVTDDLRALPELQSLVDAEVTISPVVLRAFVEREVLECADAGDRLDRVAETRSWLGAPIYRRAQDLFE